MPASASASEAQGNPFAPLVLRVDAGALHRAYRNGWGAIRVGSRAGSIDSSAAWRDLRVHHAERHARVVRVDHRALAGIDEKAYLRATGAVEVPLSQTCTWAQRAMPSRSGTGPAARQLPPM